MTDTFSCTKCGKDKESSEFGTQKRGGKSWRRRKCRDCYSEERRENYRLNPNVYKDANKRQWSKDPELYREKQRARYHKSPEVFQKRAQDRRDSGRTLEINRKRKYGISSEDIKHAFDLQDGKCAICLTKESSLKEKLLVDHCHATGKFRGLLCRKCNSGIGFLCDNVEITKSAVEYLSKTHNGENRCPK